MKPGVRQRTQWKGLRFALPTKRSAWTMLFSLPLRGNSASQSRLVKTLPAHNGQFYTYDFDEEIGLNLESDLLVIQLNKNLTYYLFLHSPDLNLITYNSMTMPIYQGIVDFDQIGNKLCTFMMKLIRHEMINWPLSTCNPEPGYRVVKCNIYWRYISVEIQEIYIC